MKELDSSVVSNSQLNNSSSKMKYSFPKSQRFGSQRYDSSSPNKFYDLPEIKSKRAAGIGYASKIDLARRSFEVPAPNTYNLNSSFDLKKNSGITIAEGRDKVKANDLFMANLKVPSPFQYNPEKPHTSLSYSLSSRVKDNREKWILSVPGPGNYDVPEITNKDTKVPISKYVSAPSTKFGRLKRLSEAELKNPKTPGPGQYENLSMVSKDFESKTGYRFPVQKRPSMANQNKTPGPGNYNRSSDFD